MIEAFLTGESTSAILKMRVMACSGYTNARLDQQSKPDLLSLPPSEADVAKEELFTCHKELNDETNDHQGDTADSQSVFSLFPAFANPTVRFKISPSYLVSIRLDPELRCFAYIPCTLR
jgi:hypothetical protein